MFWEIKCMYYFKGIKKNMLFIKLLLFSSQVLAHSCEPMDCSSPGSSVHEILQARILKWVAISFSGKSSQPRRSNIGRHILYHCATREVLFIRKEIKICKIKILDSINDIYFSQINGQILYGRSHQNASSIIKCAPSKVKIIFIR